MVNETNVSPYPPSTTAESSVPPEIATSEEVLIVTDVSPLETEEEVSTPQSSFPPEDMVAVVKSEKKVPQNLVCFKEESNRQAPNEHRSKKTDAFHSVGSHNLE